MSGTRYAVTLFGSDSARAYELALDCDRTSAFGGIVALNRPCDQATAAGISEVFTEVVIAPGFDEAALSVLTQKKNLRLLKASSTHRGEFDLQRVAPGGSVRDEVIAVADQHGVAMVFTGRRHFRH